MNRVNKMNVMDWFKRNLVMVILTVMLMGIIFFFVSMIAKSTTDFSRVELEGYYKPLEDKLVEDARSYLEQAGFRNCGVMLTRVIDDEGEREYKLTVHHAKLNALTEEMREEVAAGFEQLYFQDEHSSFRHSFLLNN